MLETNSTKLHPIEPSNSPTLSTVHRAGKHRIQGISDEFIPPIVDPGELDDVVSVDEGDSIIMAQLLASRLGLGVGISAGANFLGSLKIQNEMGSDAVVVTVFPDDNKKCLSTDLLHDEPAHHGFLSSRVRLRSFQGLKRVCHTCCDPTDCLDAMPADFVAAERAPRPVRGDCLRGGTGFLRCMMARLHDGAIDQRPLHVARCAMHKTAHLHPEHCTTILTDLPTYRLTDLPTYRLTDLPTILPPRPPRRRA